MSNDDTNERWVALAADVEAGAVAKIADAFSDLDKFQTARVAEWVKARYLSTNLIDIGLLLTEAALEPVKAMKAAVEGCPVCGGKGEMPADEHGFKARCGYCGNMRRALDGFLKQTGGSS